MWKLLRVFYFQNIFTNQTLLNDVNILPSGTFLEVSSISGEKNFTRYWDYHFEEPDESFKKRRIYRRAGEIVYTICKTSTYFRCGAGLYLSGGMDSGSIAPISSNEFRDLKTFTCGFDLSSASGIELAFDERHKAEAMSAMFKTEHYENGFKGWG